MLDGAAGASASNAHLLAGVEADLAGGAGGHDVVPTVQVHRLRLPEVAVNSDCAAWNIGVFQVQIFTISFLNIVLSTASLSRYWKIVFTVPRCRA